MKIYANSNLISFNYIAVILIDYEYLNLSIQPSCIIIS